MKSEEVLVNLIVFLQNEMAERRDYSASKAFEIVLQKIYELATKNE